MEKYLIEAVIHTDVNIIDDIINNNINALSKIDNLNDLILTLNKIFKPYNFGNTEIVGVTFSKFIKKDIDKKKPIVKTKMRHELSRVVGGISHLTGEIEIFLLDDAYKVFWKGNTENLESFINVIKEYLSHEVLHQFQYDKIFAKYEDDPEKAIDVISKYSQKSNIKTKKDMRKYLSSSLEVMGFSRMAYEEFKNNGYSNARIIEMLKNYKEINSNTSCTAAAYIKLFDGIDNKTLHKFISNVVEYAKSIKEIRIITEGKFDSLKNKIIINLLKLLKTGKNSSYDFFFVYDAEEFIISLNCEFNINLPENNRWDLDAATDFDEENDMEKLVIQLSVGKNYKAEDYNELYADIVNISAHEVKHLRDTLEDFKKDPKLDDINRRIGGKYGEYVDENEIEAYIEGFKEESEYRKEPIISTINRYLQRYLKNISNNIQNKIADIWINYGKDKYPELDWE